MSKSNLHALSQPETATNDPLHDLIRQGARDLCSATIRMTGRIASVKNQTRCRIDSSGLLCG